MESAVIATREWLMTPGTGQEFCFGRIPLESIELRSVDDLYVFVESAVRKTGLILDSDAFYCPWACSLSAQCRDVRWLYPTAPLSETLLRHLGNFAHEPVAVKGFVLIEMGRVLKAVDVNAVNGSVEPHRLGSLVHEIFLRKAKDGARARTEPRRGTLPPSSEAYQILGASEADPDSELKRKYREMILQYHPDRVSHLGPELRDLAARKTTEIVAAFSVIRRLRGM